MTRPPGGGMPDGHRWLGEVTENESVAGCYLVKEKRLGTTRQGEPFISLVLADRTGEMQARIWEGARDLAPLFQPGDVLRVTGRSSSYRGRIQATLTRIEVVEGPAEPEFFIESSPEDPADMIRSLRTLLGRVEDSSLNALLGRFLNDRVFMTSFSKAPAAKHFHHNYLGGLLEHTLSVCRLALHTARHYPRLDRDLLLVGAFLHDVGKIRELRFDRMIEYTDEGRLLGHVVLGAMILERKLAEVVEFPPEAALRLKHLILSHHGQFEFGSPKRPKFLEALVLHMVDDLDAKINGIGRFMDRDTQSGAWTDYHRLFERYFLKGGPSPTVPEPELEPTVEDPQASLFSP